MCVEIDRDDSSFVQHTTCVSKDRVTSVVIDSEAEFIVGLPINRSVVFDGGRYWAFYTEDDTLKCKTSENFDVWSPTFTDGSADFGDLNNGGRAYAIRFGRLDGENYAFGLLNRSYLRSGEAFLATRWHLTAQGLADRRTLMLSATDAPGAGGIAHLNGLYGTDHEIGEVVGTVQSYALPNATSATGIVGMEADTTVKLGEIALASIGFAENIGTLFMDDGYVLFAVDNGNTGGPRTGAGVAVESHTPHSTQLFVAEVDVTNDPDGGSFAHQNYAADTSHIGQVDHVQTDDLQSWVVFVTDEDAERGNFGTLTFNTRMGSREAKWTNVMTDMAGAQVRHVALTTDGDSLFVTYVKEQDGGPDNALYLRRYTPSADELSPELKFADIQPGHRFERMTISSRIVDHRLLVGWSEESSGLYDYRVASIYVSAFRP